MKFDDYDTPRFVQATDDAIHLASLINHMFIHVNAWVCSDGGVVHPSCQGALTLVVDFARDDLMLMRFAQVKSFVHEYVIDFCSCAGCLRMREGNYDIAAHAEDITRGEA